MSCRAVAAVIMTVLSGPVVLSSAAITTLMTGSVAMALFSATLQILRSWIARIVRLRLPILQSETCSAAKYAIAKCRNVLG